MGETVSIDDTGS